MIAEALLGVIEDHGLILWSGQWLERFIPQYLDFGSIGPGAYFFTAPGDHQHLGSKLSSRAEFVRLTR
jgi:hypothetical protein